MAKFFGCNLSQKPQIDKNVLGWLAALDNSYSVFVEVEGSDFSVDFLVFKPHGIFDVEAKHWNVREARSDANWTLTNGETRANPFLDQVLDQCTKVTDYLAIQREEIFKQKAKAFQENKSEIKVFPIVAISYPWFTGNIELHRWRKIFANQTRLLQHIRTFQWFYGQAPRFYMSPDDIERLAKLLHLDRIDHQTLAPISDGRSIVAVATPPQKTHTVSAQGAIDDTTANPYQYTYTVTGDFILRSGDRTSPHSSCA